MAMRALITIKKSTKMIAVFYNIINNKLSVRDTEKIIKEKSHQLKQNKNPPNLPTEEKKLQHYLSSKVSININKNSKENYY